MLVGPPGSATAGGSAARRHLWINRRARRGGWIGRRRAGRRRRARRGRRAGRRRRGDARRRRRGPTVWLGCRLGVAETEADGALPGRRGRSGRPGSTLVICSFAAGRSTGPLGATVGEVVGRWTAGSPALRAAARAAPSPTSATSTAAAAPTSGPRRRWARDPLATAAPAGTSVRVPGPASRSATGVAIAVGGSPPVTAVRAASAIAAPLVNRSSGSLARARDTRARTASGMSCGSSGGSSSRCRTATWSGLSP